MNRVSILTVTLLLAAVATSPSTAAIVTFDLNHQFSGGGSNPAGTAPWLRLTFTDVGLGMVDFKIENLLQDPDEFISKVYFNFDDLLTVGSLGFAHLSGQIYETLTKGPANSHMADGDGKYDLLVTFKTGSTSDRFVGGESSLYRISLAGISSSSFNFLSQPAGGAGPFHAAAHVQGIGEGGALSGWIGDGVIPAPAAVALGMIGLGILGWFKRRTA